MTDFLIRSETDLDIHQELIKAREKFPQWTMFPKTASLQDNRAARVLHAAAIVCEESGELMRAAVQYAGEGGTFEACRKEAIQCAAMCIRFLEETGSAHDQR